MADNDPDVHVRPLADVLRGVDKGRALDSAADALHALVTAVQETGKPGTITLTVKVGPLPKARTNDSLLVTASVTSKMPVIDGNPSMFFVDDEGNLTRSDPRQIRLSDTELRLAKASREAAQ